jgi:hypothetical protein
MEREGSALKILEDQNEFAMGPSENPSLKPRDPIDLDPSKAEKPAAGECRSPPPVLGDVDKSTVEATGEDAAPLIQETNVLQLQKGRCVFLTCRQVSSISL